jgi:hypothetical protein
MRDVPSARLWRREWIQRKRLSSARVRMWWVAAGETGTPGRRIWMVVMPSRILDSILPQRYAKMRRTCMAGLNGLCEEKSIA